MSMARVLPWRRKAGKSWTRVHLIYFLLAVFDLLAVGGGLYLSNQFAAIFNRTLAAGRVWDQSFVELWRLDDFADGLSAPPAEIFDSRDPVGASRKFERAMTVFQKQMQVIDNDFARNVKPDEAQEARLAMLGISSTLTDVTTNSRLVFSNYYNGWITRAAKSMALADRANNQLKSQLKTAIAAIRYVKRQHELQSSNEVRRLESYQTLIGLGILIMVCCVSVYGSYVGRLLASKHRELDDACDGLRRSEARAVTAAAELQAVNESVVALNRELSDSMKRLQEAQDTIIRKAKLAQLGQLTATVAHEIRNPLGIVRAAAYLIERRLDCGSSDVTVQVERINDGIARCDAIITELLDFTRTRSLEPAPVHVDEWLSKVVIEQAVELPAMIEVECRYGLPGSRIAFDPTHMQRVIINLLSNAAEAMVGKGKDPAKFHTPDPRIVIETLASDRGVEIWFTDNGPGISEENLRRIREPLFTTKSYGVGLGLPAVERILDQHGGGLEIVSKVGRGTTMKVWLPVRSERKRVA